MTLMDAIHGLTCLRKSPHPRHLDQEEFGESPPHTWQVSLSFTASFTILTSQLQSSSRSPLPRSVKERWKSRRSLRIGSGVLQTM